MICTECFLDICRCGALCENRRFQNCLYAEFYPRPFPGKGWGLCALQAIRKGQFICEMTGEVFSLNSNEGTTRMLAYKQRPATYVMKLSEGLVLDATVKGNWGRLINHSCAPNALTEKWNVVGSTCIGIFAIRDIRPG
jgi:SET domain-containing protein